MSLVLVCSHTNFASAKKKSRDRYPHRPENSIYIGRNPQDIVLQKNNKKSLNFFAKKC